MEKSHTNQKQDEREDEKNAHTNFGYAHDMSAFMFVSHNKDGIS